MMIQRRSKIIAFLSDFGVDSIYPGIVKGVIKGINPAVAIVDLTHSIPPFDVELGAFFLNSSFRWFPSGTIFLSVVDPGVGGQRRALIIETKRYTFVGPDNGLMWPAAVLDGIVSTYTIARGEYTFDTGCETFHGRDIFGPVATHLSLGVLPEKLGIVTGGIAHLEIPGEAVSGNSVEGTVLFVDAFGNVVTSVQSSTFRSFSKGEKEFSVNGVLGLAVETFEEVPGGVLGIVPGSFDSIEICLNRGNASSYLGVKRGDRVGITRK